MDLVVMNDMDRQMIFICYMFEQILYRQNLVDVNIKYEKLNISMKQRYAIKIALIKAIDLNSFKYSVIFLYFFCQIAALTEEKYLQNDMCVT